MENNIIGFGAKRIESEEKESREVISGYSVVLTPEQIEKIDLPLEGLTYEGKGASSYSPDYDQQKQDYLKSFGIEVEGLGHAETVTSFIIFSHIVSLKLVEESGGNLDKATKIANKILNETRIDRLGYRDSLGNGVTYEGVRKRLGFVANTEGRLSEEQYSQVLTDILNSLNKKIDLRE